MIKPTKQIVCLMLCLAFSPLVGGYALATSQAAEAEMVAEEASPYFLLNGVAHEDPGLTVYQNTTYVSLASAAVAFWPGCSITWEGDYVVVTAQDLSVRMRVGDQYIEANGRYLYVPNKVIVGNERVLVPVRTIVQAMGGAVAWNAQTGEVEIYSGGGSIASGASYYDGDSVYWLSHIINAESGNQPLEGKLAVGTVIMNRVVSSRFPSSISEVICAPNQFTPVRSGSINRTPNTESVIAAKLVLEGVRVGGNSLYFVNPSTAPNSWAQRNRPYVTTIGAHAFFA